MVIQVVTEHLDGPEAAAVVLAVMDKIHQVLTTVVLVVREDKVLLQVQQFSIPEAVEALARPVVTEQAEQVAAHLEV
jgi:hypothetical protein